jgi:PhnB protein
MKQHARVMPMIYVDPVEDARAFYVDKLGFAHQMGMLGKDGRLDFCTVTREGAQVMLMRPMEEMAGTSPAAASRPVEFYIEVSDVDGYFDDLAAKKVKAETELTNQWWGDRTFTIRDPFGYKIWFYQNVGEPELPAGAKVF